VWGEEGFVGPSDSYAASEDSSFLIPTRRSLRRWGHALLSDAGKEDRRQLA